VTKTRWYPAQQWHHCAGLSEQTATWLLDSTSLTQRLQLLCPDFFNVEVLTQQWQHPLLSEKAWLEISAQHHVRIREVYLRCKTNAWVFARTVIPPQTLVGKYRRLANLGKHPLGHVLFAERTVQRRAFYVARLTMGHPLYQLATQRLSEKPTMLWARRSIFYLLDKPLLINEIFLPSFQLMLTQQSTGN